jgi:hypothetical protein
MFDLFTPPASAYKKDIAGIEPTLPGSKPGVITI